jgi:hypothetical protein
MNTFLTGCPADCDDIVLLPVFPVEQDCTSYPQTLAEISDLFIVPDGATDLFATFATTPTYVASSVNNNEAANAKSKWLVGIGTLPAPEKTETPYPKQKSKTTKRTYTLTFTYYQLDATSYEMLRKIQCGSTAFTFYYADLGDWVYGIQGGIAPSFVDVDFPHGSGDVPNQAVITLKWEADGDPQRRVNPFSAP